MFHWGKREAETGTKRGKSVAMHSKCLRSLKRKSFISFAQRHALMQGFVFQREFVASRQRQRKYFGFLPCGIGEFHAREHLAPVDCTDLTNARKHVLALRHGSFQFVFVLSVDGSDRRRAQLFQLGAEACQLSAECSRGVSHQATSVPPLRSALLSLLSCRSRAMMLQASLRELSRKMISSMFRVSSGPRRVEISQS